MPPVPSSRFGILLTPRQMQMQMQMRTLMLMLTLMLGLLLALATPAAATEVTLEAYRTQLVELEAALAHGEQEHVQALAGTIGPERIAWQGELLRPDPRLIRDLVEHHPRQAQRTLSSLLEALPREGRQEAAVAGVDAQALSAIAQRQREALPPPSPEDVEMPLGSPPESWTKPLLEALSWLGERLDRLFKALIDLFSPLGGQASHAGMWVVGVVVALLVAGALVLGLMRRSAPLPAAAAGPPRAARDADPRSRAAAEWARYAAELAAAGRGRESVRAWYHAVLVQCWQADVIHHRTGSTNWEYVRRLPADWRHRQRFQELTLGFDRTWYGGQADEASCGLFAASAADLYRALLARA